MLITWFLSLAQFLWYVPVIVKDVIAAAAIAATLVISRHHVSVFCILLASFMPQIYPWGRWYQWYSFYSWRIWFLVGKCAHKCLSLKLKQASLTPNKASEPLTIRMYLCIFIFICSIKDLNYYGRMYCRH